MGKYIKVSFIQIQVIGYALPVTMYLKICTVT